MFTDRLRELIDEKCEGRQSILAKKSGLATTVISSYFCRKSQPSLSQLIALSQALECSIDYLAGTEDDFGNITIKTENPAPQLSDEEKELLKNFRKLPSGDHPCCLKVLYHIPEILSIKNFSGAASGVVFSCSPALIQSAGRGIPIYQLSRQLHRGGSSPPSASSNTEKAARGFPFSFKPYLGSPLAGLPAF